MAKREILYVAAGAGLGHLTRACAVAWHLKALGVPARILSHSLYAEGMRHLTGAAIEFVPAARWMDDAPRYARAIRPAMVVLDTFPWGLRGEWRPVEAAFRFVTLARRLNVTAYCEALGASWDRTSPTLRHAVISEPLAAEHEALLAESGGTRFRLPGRIRFPAEEFPTPLPAELAAVLDRGRAWLVVHSGPDEEVRQLIRRAEVELHCDGAGELAVIAPRPVAGLVTAEYFPAARLYAAAQRVWAGGGYNSVAELSAYPDKRRLVAFPRRYDDQAGRLASIGDCHLSLRESSAAFAERKATDGAAAAAAILREILEQ